MKNKFKLSRVAALVAVAITGLTVSQLTIAGAGFTDVIAADGTTNLRKATFFAYSPTGVRDTAIPEGDTLGVGQNTGKALRKFIDPLPLPGAANAKTMADGITQKYIPVAMSSKWVNPKGLPTTDDYYEIGIVEYSEKFHSDLAKATTLRGYVQIDHLASNGLTGADGNKFLPGSKQFALTYPGGAPIMIAGTDAKGKLTGSKVQALAVDVPHFLGPVIAATKDTPTRLKVLNLLPVGRAEFVDAVKQEVDPVTGDLTNVNTFTVTNRRGDLFLPVDKSILGAGVGPDGYTEYTQNRASVHLHGGDTPWISDGTPHQWITPAGENDPSVTGSLASAFTADGSYLDPAMLPNYIKGVSTENVPDMNDPGDGAMTLYYPNGHTARMEWYHDHTFGSTRLNVYAGMASAYLVTDAVEAALVTGGTVGTGSYQKTVEAVLPPASRTIPLVLQDRTFVPDDIALQDAHWNTSAWGQPGDSWFPHVYETVQDPNQANNWNAVGRWHYGPWFWPVFPALYNLPEGTYSPAGYENTVTTTPEGWNDTPIVNGVAYPTLEVDPTTYRFRLLNASNDRMMTFNLFEATSDATLADGTVVHAVQNGVAVPTEVDMVPAAAVLAVDACPAGERRPILNVTTGKYCTPETWPTDGRIGGVPSPARVGPTIYQVANESGWLPAVAVHEPTPINYIQDKGRIVVLNVDMGNSGLLLAPAERADVVVDFSQYAGKTLLVYNDSGAPVPAGDPRNDLFTGVGDQTGQGGTEDTKAGYGPNTRTMMQIKVRGAAVNPVSPPLDAANVAKLETSISNAYFSDSERRPVVAQDVYAGFDTTGTWSKLKPTEMYGDIYLGSLKNPTFQFVPGTPSTGLASVLIAPANQGAGYVVAPAVSIAKPAATGGIAATGVSTMKIDKITVSDPGKGYTSAPLMSFSQGGGNGAMANAFLRVDKATTAANVTASGAGYTPNAKLLLTFTAAPGKTASSPAGVTATGYATVNAQGRVSGITIVNAGSGYTAIPAVTITNKTVTVTGTGATATIALAGLTSPGLGAKAKVTGVVDSILLYGTDNTTPTMSAATSGGGGYTDLTPGTFNVNIRGGLPLDANGVPVAPAVNAVGVATGKVYDITLTNPGSGYVSGEAPVVTLTPKVASDGTVTQPTTKAVATATAAASGGKASYLVKTKTIQELFDPTYGRLNATLGVELPFTSAMTQTTIPLGYVDETTEQFAEGETQIWKITHNGVDSHPVHFHLLDVQVINRVGWDGFIQPIEPKEMGWKETVMMSPLEDIIVAVRAKKPKLPGFGVPLSNRLMDPTQPEGSPFGFTQIDPNSGNPAVVTNAWKNYGWEYVWHCHILGHEENDFMRPVKFDANEVVPSAPTLVAAGLVGSATGVTINWTDTSSTEYRFDVQRAKYTGNNLGAFASIGSALANAPSFVDTTATDSATVRYAYQVVAVGANGSTASAVASTPAMAVPLVAPNSVATSYAAATAAVAAVLPTRRNPNGTPAIPAQPASVDITWRDRSDGETQFVIQRSTNGGAFVDIATVLSTSGTSTNGINYTYSNVDGTGANDVTLGNTYVYQVIAQTVVSGFVTASSPASATATMIYAMPTAPAALTASAVHRTGSNTSDNVTLSWTAPAAGTTVTVQRITPTGITGANAGTSAVVTNSTASSTVDSGVRRSATISYTYQIRSNNAIGSSVWVQTTGVIVN